MMNVAEGLLEKAGIRVTPHRRAVLKTVLDAAGAVTAPDMEERLSTGEHAMNRVTLYRTLDLLTEAGVLRRTNGPGRAFQYCLGHGHGHFHCRKCGRTQCLETAPLNTVLLLSGLPERVEVEQVDIRLDGLCAACRNKEAGRRS